MTADSLTVEGLGLQPGPKKQFHRFDIFSTKYSRGGEGSVELLLLFLKFRNYIKGRYFAQLVKPLLQKHDLESSRVATEYKVPIFGTDSEEWGVLAEWMHDNELYSTNNRWVIQIPRILHIRAIPGFYKCATLQEQLDNIFLPMWQASVYPEKFPQLDTFLANIVAFTVISDEVTKGQILPEFQPPLEWPWHRNPPDIYFNYYIWANLYSLNAYRRSRGMK
eukprot:RCo003980